MLLCRWIPPSAAAAESLMLLLLLNLSCCCCCSTVPAPGYGWFADASGATVSNKCPQNQYNPGFDSTRCMACPMGLSTDPATLATTVNACGTWGKQASRIASRYEAPRDPMKGSVAQAWVQLSPTQGQEFWLHMELGRRVRTVMAYSVQRHVTAGGIIASALPPCFV